MAGAFFCLFTLNFSAGAGSINYSGRPLWVPEAPTEVTGWREVSWPGGKRDTEGAASPSLRVDMGPSGGPLRVVLSEAEANRSQFNSCLHHLLVLSF